MKVHFFKLSHRKLYSLYFFLKDVSPVFKDWRVPSVQDLDWCTFQNCKFGYSTDKIKSPVDLNTNTKLRLHSIQADVVYDLVAQCHSMEIQIFHHCVSSTRAGQYTFQMLYTALIHVLAFARRWQRCDISKHLLPIIPCCTVRLWNRFYSRAPWHLARQVLWWSSLPDTFLRTHPGQTPLFRKVSNCFRLIQKENTIILACSEQISQWWQTAVIEWGAWQKTKCTLTICMV